MRAFRVAYDGDPYRGFQRQPDVRTVEGTLFRALRRHGVFEGEKPENYAAAGRTDAGVSALAQTVAFECPEWLTPAAFNGELPAEIRVWASADAEGFHARYDALSRAYAYHLHAPAADDELLRAALDRFVGAHDFHNLTPDGGDTTRTIREADLEREGEFVVVTVRADGFLRQLVRRLVSLVAAVGRGERDPAFAERALSDERLTGPEGIPPAPPEPLVLVDVTYDLDFEVDERGAESAREVFGEKRVEREAGARVAGFIERGVDG
ncbi:tRNA pseudouridine(38-40) synthase TruA [Halalkalicoccus sp. NIPERK01]|uniref:tRNA pseudouridine(38-40) synthase TruA n=1 Tax=Halalkalicoccus sp. NIPERK01 TaxID=3053469 RepID=UPI00256F45DC|nr:tRNA pseudouridine(38-40) synthase TruA [Halalkalicoccus sp. NIPERK01]MDL5362407.1 tRNA pseudouridine(38-40) synthase TruA [Halalkalicoccus sp. NIPERK01]